MKNFIQVLIIAFFAIIVFNVNGQNVGFKIGSDWSNANLKHGDTASSLDKQYLIAPKIGVIFETPIYNGIFLQTGLMVSLSGFRFDDKRTIDDSDGNPVIVDSKERPILLYLDLPVNFGYKHPVSDRLSVFGMVGPVFRYLTYSTWTYLVDGEWDNESTKIEDAEGKEENLFNSFDIGLNVEAGVQFDRFQFGLYYAPSFSNIYNEDVAGKDASWKNYSFGVTFSALLGEIK
jgi:hypothetical protein